jgi:hypothetical protein
MYQNPMNDFYFRQAQSQPYQQSFNFPPYEPQINASWVSNVEEARAAQMNFVSTNVYLDTSNGKIYIKRMGDNGKPQFLSYILEEEIVRDPLTEINSRLTKIEKYLGGQDAKSIPGNANAKQSKSISYSATTEQDESDETTESTGLSKGYGNDER